MADFTGAKLNGEVDPKAFEFEVPKDAKLVEFLVPPHMGQLLNKKVPDFKFTDLGGQAGHARDDRRQDGRARLLVGSLRAVPANAEGAGRGVPKVQRQSESRVLRGLPRSVAIEQRRAWRRPSPT